MKTNFKYIYGPVPSWRLGSSLGIDLLSQKDKVCNFDCVYCQLGPNKGYVSERKTYVSVRDVVKEIKELPEIDIDYITFSGTGEPTLAANLGEAIKAVKLVRKEPIAVLTNSSLMGLEEVRKELLLADLVVAKLDAYSAEFLREINAPVGGIGLSGILEGIKAFKISCRGKLALQMMFIESNRNHINSYISMADRINPDEVQINTPLRPCRVRPLPKDEILKIKGDFALALKKPGIVSVYDNKTAKDVISISDEDTLKRRGKVKK